MSPSEENEQDTHSLCPECSKLSLQRSDFEAPPFEPDGRYKSVAMTGTLETLEVKQTTCRFCRLIWLAIQKDELANQQYRRKAPPQTVWEIVWAQNMDYAPNIEGIEDKYDSVLYPRLVGISNDILDYCIQLVDEPETKDFLRARAISEVINANMVRSWLMNCSQEHGPNCKTVALGSLTNLADSIGGLLVIDVIHQCLVELPTGSKYVALSYVWGSQVLPMTLQCNLTSFKQPRAFLATPLPRTIVDAIEVVKALDQHYLWVDSLCIVQDHAMKHDLIQRMDIIYGSAYFCIIAASGIDAQAGLSGWKTNRVDTNVVPVETIGPHLRLGVLPFFYRELMNSPHAQRGWTLQEGVLSTRCLIFLNSCIYFSCRAAIWREDIHTELGDRVIAYEDTAILSRTTDEYHLRTLSDHLNAYTGRTLSFQSDALNAFAGIENALARSMDNTRFWHGLPACVFDWALLWSGTFDSRLQRRPTFPSWSWAGWTGRVSMATDHYSEFDHEWLRSRTWINWYIVDTHGRDVLVWAPDRDGTQKSRLHDHAIISDDRHSSRGQHDDSTSEEAEENEENDTDTDDAECCPQYGWPTADDAYGRQTRTDCLPFDLEQVQFSSEPLSNTLPAGTLRFKTMSASYTLGSSSMNHEDSPTSSKSTHLVFYTLLDREQRVCGVVWDLGTLALSDLGPDRSVEVLILSFSAPGTKLPFDALKIDLPPPYQRLAEADDPDGEDFLGDWHSWDMFNVLLVASVVYPTNEQSDSSASDMTRLERRSVGVLHKVALDHALTHSARWKEVSLY